MPNLDAVSFLTPGALGAAIEVTVANIASPTELNARAAAQGDIILARTTEAGTGTQTWYYADTTSDAQSLPYIVSSATAGVKFIAVAGRYQNQSINSAALTASRVVTTDVSKNLDTPATVTTTQAWAFSSTVTVVDGSFSITGSSDATKTIKFEVDAQTASDDLTINSGAQTDDRTLSIPVLTGNDTIGTLGVPNTWTLANTFSGTDPSTSTVTGNVINNGGYASSRASFFRGLAGSGDTSALLINYFSNQSVDPASFRSCFTGINNCAAAAAGNTSFTTGANFLVQHSVAALTLADSAAFYGSTGTTTGGAVMTRAYGYYNANTSEAGTVGTKYAFYTQSLTGATTHYAFFSAGVGLVSIGDTTEATAIGTAGLVTASGASVAKRSFLGTIGSSFKGNVLAGVQDGTATAAGQVGEVLSSTVSGVAVAGSGGVGNVTSVSLTPGDWLISGNVVITGGATGLTSGSTAKMSIVTTTATNGTSGSTMTQGSVLALLANGLFELSIPQVRVNISATTTYYLTEEVTYISGSPVAAGTLIATRIR